MIIHHISLDQIDKLEEIFATLTPKGWIIPQWLISLKWSVKSAHSYRTTYHYLPKE